MRHLWLGDATTSRPSEISVTHITMVCVLNGLRSGFGGAGSDRTDEPVQRAISAKAGAGNPVGKTNTPPRT